MNTNDTTTTQPDNTKLHANQKQSTSKTHNDKKKETKKEKKNDKPDKPNHDDQEPVPKNNTSNKIQTVLHIQQSSKKSG